MSSRKSAKEQSKIEKMHQEATLILSQKRDEIEELNNQIDEAEKQCAQLRAELAAKTNAMKSSSESESESYDEEEESPEIQAAKHEFEEEILRINREHDEELHNLKVDYARKLKTAEEWNQQHSETLKIDKQAQIQQLKAEIDALKVQQTEMFFTATQSRTKFHQESKQATITNEQRIQELESQLTDIASVAREEIRDVRSKIEECLVTIELRQKEHENECRRYEREISERKEKYESHVNALAEQLSSERDRLSQAAAAAETKTQSLERVLKQLEKHHQKQLQATQSDIDRMRGTITQARAREDASLSMTRTNVSAIQTATREVRGMEQELELIKQDIEETSLENEELRAEIARLERVAKKSTRKL